jgi:polysaccharide export outer membrane protein
MLSKKNRSFLTFVFSLGLLLAFFWVTTPAFAAVGQPGFRAPASAAGEDGALPSGAGGGAAALSLPQGTVANGGYVLGVGDKIRLTVYGEADLSGEYDIGSTGTIALPLIGEIQAASRTLHAFEEAVRSKLSEGYLRDPRVSAQVMNYRPFFILGEVSKPGSYPYVNGMNVLNAVALAGGYTYRADRSGVTVIHASDPEKKEKNVTEDASVAPGDILRVPERFF